METVPMKKLILVALATATMLGAPASAQYRTIERPDGSVVTYDERQDRSYNDRDRYDGQDRYDDRSYDRDYRDRDYDRDYRDRADGYNDRAYGNRRYGTRVYRTRTYTTRRIVRPRATRRCSITWRHHQRVQTCVMTRRY